MKRVPGQVRGLPASFSIDLAVTPAKRSRYGAAACAFRS